MRVSELIRIYIDGASQGNPGPAGIGIALMKNSATQPLQTAHKYIGETTNNVAEYAALIYALQEALILGHRAIEVCTDSELIAKQVRGEYKVREPQLQSYADQVQHLRQGFDHFEIRAIPREQNRLADQLATEAIESRFDRSLKRATSA